MRLLEAEDGYLAGLQLDLSCFERSRSPVFLSRPRQARFSYANIPSETLFSFVVHFEFHPFPSSTNVPVAPIRISPSVGRATLRQQRQTLTVTRRLTSVLVLLFG